MRLARSCGEKVGVGVGCRFVQWRDRSEGCPKVCSGGQCEMVVVGVGGIVVEGGSGLVTGWLCCGRRCAGFQGVLYAMAP